MINYCRPLIDNVQTKEFVIGVLGLEDKNEISIAVGKITKAEMHLSSIKNKCTFSSDSYRNTSFADEIDRIELRTQIFEELIRKKRLDNDDEIKKGEGGALPRSDLKSEKKAVIITGLPASGKSTIASKVADNIGAIILDSDFAKRKFPEFEDEFGASLVHEESSAVIFGDEKNRIKYNVKEYCISEGYNVVIPKIGHDKKSILDLAKYFKDFGYSVHLILVSLDRREATIRAYKRFIKTKRYVPLAIIFDVYANDPILTYYRIKNEECFDSYSKVSTKDVTPLLIEKSENSPLEL